jgi:hypothetical protein
MNVEIETDPAQFLFWKYLFQIFGILSLQCERNACSIQTLDILTKFDVRCEFCVLVFKYYNLKNKSGEGNALLTACPWRCLRSHLPAEGLLHR